MTAVSPDARRIWGAAKGPLVVGAIVLAAAVVITLIRGTGGEGGSLDPRSYQPSGSHALAKLLEDNGVRIDITDDASDVDGATLFVVRPALLDPARMEQLSKRAATTVLVMPTGETGRAKIESRPAGCSFADKAGSATTGGFTYSGEEECYGSSLVRVGDVWLVGAATIFTNGNLDEEGNAALALKLLGQHDRLVWYIPSVADLAQQKEFGDLIPAGWRYGGWMLLFAGVVFALWRARRLGRIVVEQLPVVVRAAETVEGRARLYRRSHAADHSAAILRQAARDRLAPLLGMPHGVDLTDEVARRTSRSANEVRTLLYAQDPLDDRGLVALADGLDALENEVRKG